MKNIVEYKGYTAVQSGYNNHVMLFKNGRCEAHISVDGLLTEAEICIIIDNHISLSKIVSENKRDMPRKDYPPYMTYPRKSSVNVCDGCVHEATNKGSFPCDECKRKLRGEHDMFAKKVEE